MSGPQLLLFGALALLCPLLPDAWAVSWLPCTCLEFNIGPPDGETGRHRLIEGNLTHESAPQLRKLLNQQLGAPVKGCFQNLSEVLSLPKVVYSGDM